MEHKYFSVAFTVLLGLLFFAGFSYDIENDRDVFTWWWLLASMFFFYLAHLIFNNTKDEQ